MTMIGVYGASDDLVEIEIDGKPWEELPEPASLVFTAEGKAFHVDVEFTAVGWRLGVRLDDDSESGDLPFLVSVHQRNYSPLVLVQAITSKPMVMTWWEDGKPKTRAFPGASVAGERRSHE